MVLVIGLDLAGAGIEPEHGAGIEIVAGVHLTRPRRGIADAPINGLRVVVVRAGHPGRTAAGLPVVALPGVVAGLALTRNGEGPPELLAVLGIEGRDITPDAEL